MDKSIAFTVNVFKLDRRVKGGEKLVESRDYTPTKKVDLADVATLVTESYPADKFRVEVVNTYVEVTNFMNPDVTFWERYNTPYYCSPSSETYWSM